MPREAGGWGGALLLLGWKLWNLRSEPLDPESERRERDSEWPPVSALS